MAAIITATGGTRKARCDEPVAPVLVDRYIDRDQGHQPETRMRAEIEAIVDEIKRSLGLLRRHL